MAVKDSAQEPYSYPVYLHIYLPLTISWKVKKGWKLNVVHTLMLIRISAEDKNHNPI